MCSNFPAFGITVSATFICIMLNLKVTLAVFLNNTKINYVQILTLDLVKDSN
jgi:hypothetical protein